MYTPALIAEMRVALLSLFAVASRVPGEICGAVIDAATEQAGEIDRDLIGMETPEAATAARLGAARLLNSLCAACGGCARGVTGETPLPLMRHPRKPAA